MAGAESGVAVAARVSELSLEQLGEVVVSTASRLEERLDRAAASVYVITAEDIRRAGATTLAQALRLVPTLNVARADSSQYAISGRGFNNVLANKLLVMIDGRTVYTPLFSGVFWEAQDLMLDDVDRIEVVTGPNAALWGSNAVNGVIHVITREARATLGLAARLQAGDRERSAAVRWGGEAGDQGQFRVYGKGYGRNDSRRGDGSSVNDAADGGQVGFRADWSVDRDAYTVDGAAYRAQIDQLPAPRRISGAHLRTRWDRGWEGGAASSIQFYWDHTERVHPQVFSERLDTFDVAGQFSFRPAEGHSVVVGGGYRRARDQVGNGVSLAFVPGSRYLSWQRLFVQDRIDFTPQFNVTFAASMEGNPYTGNETLPSIRGAWVASETQMVWASLARAVRAPSRIDREYFQPAQPPYVVAGGANFRSEISDVAELGYRSQPAPSLSFSAVLFQHRHHRLRSLTPTADGLVFENNIAGATTGIEAWARWRVSERWRVDAGLVGLRQRLHVVAGAADAGGMASLGNDPRAQASLRSSLDFGGSFSWDFAVRHVGALPNPAVPAYWSADTRLAWRVRPGLEAAFGVTDLGDPQHPEWGAPATRAEIRRGAYLQLSSRM